LHGVENDAQVLGLELAEAVTHALQEAARIRTGSDNRHHTVDLNGQVFAFFIIAVAAAEAAVGLAIVLAFYRLKSSVQSDEADQLRH